jgi:succinyl-CoA synthetase alpha subunit
MQGVRFGHAGALVEGSNGSPAAKIARMRAAGIILADRLGNIPTLIREQI